MNITPDCKEIEALAASYPVIPVCREIFADIVTPITLLRKIAAKSSRYYLLESIEGGEKWGRYSFLGYDPVLKVTLKDQVIRVHHYGQPEADKVIRTEKPYDCIQHDRLCGACPVHQKRGLQ